MRRNPLVGFFLILCCVGLMECSSLAQDSVKQLDLGIKLFNPSILGLDSQASATSIGGQGLNFGLESPGRAVITVRITTKRVVVTSQSRLEALLSENGILPDSNAISFIYYLNPDLASVRTIGPRTELRLPILQLADTTVDAKLPRQPIVALVVEPKLKEALRKDIDAFRSTANRKRNDFVPTVAADLKTINVSLDQFYKDQVPSSQEMLEQIQENVTTLQSILVRYSRKSRMFRKQPKLVLNAEDSRLFSLIRTDLLEKLGVSSEGNPNVPVTVQTFKDGVEVSHFIVCYVPEAKHKANECQRSFPAQSSPTEHPISVATYIFWAIKPGDTNPASDVRRIIVRRNPQPVHLTIISRPD